MSGFDGGFVCGLCCGVLLGIGISIIVSWLEFRRNKIEYEKENQQRGDNKE